MKGIKRRLVTTPPKVSTASTKNSNNRAKIGAIAAHVSEEDSDEDEDGEEGEGDDEDDLDEDEALETEEETIKYLQRENKKQRVGNDVGIAGIGHHILNESCSMNWKILSLTAYYCYCRGGVHSWCG